MLGFKKSFINLRNGYYAMDSRNYSTVMTFARFYGFHVALMMLIFIRPRGGFLWSTVIKSITCLINGLILNEIQMFEPV